MEEELELEEDQLKKKKKPTKEELKILKMKAKLEFDKKLIRDEFTREAAMVDKSMRRGLQNWMTTCQTIKLAELRNDVEGWAQNAEFVYITKRKILEKNFEELEVTKEMFYRSFARHIYVMDYLEKCFQAIRGIVKTSYVTRASYIVDNLHIECYERQKSFDVNNSTCESIIHMAKNLTDKLDPADGDSFIARKLNVINAEIIRRYALRDKVVEKMNGFQNQLIAFVQPLMEHYGDPQKIEQLNIYENRRIQMQIDMLKGMEEERKANATLAALTRELMQQERSSMQIIQSLRSERFTLIQIRKEIREKVDTDRQLCIELIRYVGIESRHVSEKLQYVQSYGEQLLHLAKCCRKHQTQKEKVVNWSNVAKEGQIDEALRDKIKLTVINTQAHLNMSEDQFAEDFVTMGNFWKRYSLLEAQNLLLTKEKIKLTEENEKYRNIIRSMGKRSNIKTEDLCSAMTVCHFLTASEA